MNVLTCVEVGMWREDVVCRVRSETLYTKYTVPDAGISKPTLCGSSGSKRSYSSTCNEMYCLTQPILPSNSLTNSHKRPVHPPPSPTPSYPVYPPPLPSSHPRYLYPEPRNPLSSQGSASRGSVRRKRRRRRRESCRGGLGCG